MGYGPASAGAVSAYRPGPVLARKPRRVHSASWVSMLRGLMPSRAARSRPAQSRPCWLAMMRVTWSLLVSGGGWRGPGGWSFRLGGRAAGPVRGRGDDGDLHPGDPRGQLGPVLVADVVPGGGAFHFPGAVACPPGGQQAGEDGAADPADVVWVAGVFDAARGDDLLPRGFERGGEAGPVRVGSGRFGGGGHRHAQRLVHGQEGP